MESFQLSSQGGCKSSVSSQSGVGKRDLEGQMNEGAA